MNEIWRMIKGYEELYEVSNWGRVRSWYYHGNRRKEPKILKPVKTRNDGYLQVNLCKNVKVKYFSVHRLVAEAFLPNPQNLPQVNHKYEDGKHLNFVWINGKGEAVPEFSMIEWCDCKYNINFGTHNERMAKTRSKPVLQYDKDGNLIREWPSAMEVQRQTGWDNSSIGKCCLQKPRFNTAHGYVWRYKEQ